MDIKKEFDVVAKALREDESFYYGWQSNIAMAFVDVLTNAGYDFPDRNILANRAAKNFLDLLIKEKKIS